MVTALPERQKLRMGEGIDPCTKAGAMMLAERVREFWGGRVDVKVERIERGHGRHALWVVRSSLKDGLPPEAPARFAVPCR